MKVTTTMATLPDLKGLKIAVIGLGYVGLPLAVEFGKKFTTVGFDIDPQRIAALSAGRDNTLEVEDTELAAAEHLTFSASEDDLEASNVFIVTVPTPINPDKTPDLRPLKAASATVGKWLRRGDVVIFESTVYPGATEDDCVPVLEAASGLKLNEDFHVGYSPERINPGDKAHRLPDILKITSGSSDAAADMIDALYAQIITAGTFRAQSIRVAEAAKVIENTQRDLNIALINELAIIFAKLGIDTQSVLDAAGTKWNFLPFRPGLVGGHCIGVDPYYLTAKAAEVGYHPEVILAGRRINDGMGAYVASRLVKTMIRGGQSVHDARVLVLGLTFKENCPDIRNTRVIDVISELRTYCVDVDVHDPWVDARAASAEHGVELIDAPPSGSYDAVLLCVAHDEFRAMGADGLRAFGRPGAIFFDVKSVFDQAASDLRL